MAQTNIWKTFTKMINQIEGTDDVVQLSKEKALYDGRIVLNLIYRLEQCLLEGRIEPAVDYIQDAKCRLNRTWFDPLRDPVCVFIGTELSDDPGINEYKS